MVKATILKPGERFNYLVSTGNRQGKSTRNPLQTIDHEFKCDCGNIVWKKLPEVRRGDTKTCGVKDCSCRAQIFNKLKKGDKYHHLIVTGNYKIFPKGSVTIGKNEFLCDCGSVSYIRPDSVVSGKTQCCGIVGCPYIRLFKHGHGSELNPNRARKEYDAWVEMRRRCTNEKCKAYKNYGGRGITVCKEFDSFQIFLDHVGMAPSPAHSIDRINNDKGYEIGNLRWADRFTQAKNRRPRKLVKRDNEIVRLKREMKKMKKELEELKSQATHH